MRTTLIGLIVSLALIAPATVDAETTASNRPRLVVMPNTEVKNNEILLRDIAQISVVDETQRAIGEALGKISLGDAPAPKTSTTILGTTILEAISAAGFKPTSFGYSIPRAVVIKRSGRLLEKDEVISALKQDLEKDTSLDLRVRDVKWPHDHIIPLGETAIQITQLGEPTFGKLPLRIEITVNEQRAARFLGHALVDYWQEVPVLSRTLERGMLIAPDDVQLVRLNRNRYPTDIVEMLDNVVGKRLTQRIVAGETIRRSQIDIPPMIERGALVTVVYAQPGIEATASGVAMVDGLYDEIITVQNARSKRIIRARVKTPHKVEIVVP